jgi:elongation factor Ts
MQITASMVKELRERTSAGMMECKKALSQSNGSMENAIELLRKSGLAKADRKASRIAAEGIIAASISADKTSACLLEINCETDFVAKGGEFREFAQLMANKALGDQPADIEGLMRQPMGAGSHQSLDEARQELVAKLGENIQARRFDRMISDGGQIGYYLHGARIGVLVDLRGGDSDLAKDIAMHVAASRPVCITPSEVPKAMIDKEKEIFSAQAQTTGKPANIIDKMVEGRLNKFLAEVTLTGQSFVKDPNISVGQLLAQSRAEVVRFVRFEVGEGIDKKTENFAQEVMAQVKGG